MEINSTAHIQYYTNYSILHQFMGRLSPLLPPSPPPALSGPYHHREIAGACIRMDECISNTIQEVMDREGVLKPCDGGSGPTRSTWVWLPSWTCLPYALAAPAPSRHQQGLGPSGQSLAASVDKSWWQKELTSTLPSLSLRSCCMRLCS